jgi:GAF domain-containing protein
MRGPSLVRARNPAVVPLIARGRCVGALAVDNAGSHRPMAPRLATFRTFAAHAAMAIEDARLYAALKQGLAERSRAEEALRQHNAYLAALQDTALGLLGRLELTDLLQDVVGRAASLMDTRHGLSACSSRARTRCGC